MTRRDYIGIAKAVNQSAVRFTGVHGADKRVIDEDRLIMELRKVMQADNPRFDVNRFEQACKAGVK